MTTKVPALSKDKLKVAINDFFLMNFSERDRKSMTALKTEENGDPVEAGASEILRKIRSTDPALAAKIVAFTPHPSCQGSLTRELLVEIRLERRGEASPSWKRPSPATNPFSAATAVA